MNATQPPRVLLVEDSVSLALTYREYLHGERCSLQHVVSGADALRRIDDDPPDAVLLDLNLPEVSGMEILRHIHDNEIPVEVIIITAHGSVDIAVDAMRYGAFDFLVKPFDAKRLRITLRNALERHRLENLVDDYRESYDRRSYFGFVGNSLPMQAVYRTIESAAPSRATAFITGESGTGKEICAEAIHRASPRADRPLVVINCAAIPGELMESEIFGHVKGAFTGAQGAREGAASRADGGTLFLDEICEMNLDLQSKLLRFTQTGRFQRVGGAGEEQVDVRFVCATNRDPLEEVRAGRFREDLYYRLHVIPVHLPPLRERDGDVLDVGRHLLTEFAREEGKAFQDFDHGAREAIFAYAWPGNVRELQNVIRNVVVLNNGDVVTRAMLPEMIRETAKAGTGEIWRGARNEQAALTSVDERVEPLHVVERRVIERAIALCDGNVPHAASLLGVNPSTLYRKRRAWDRGGG